MKQELQKIQIQKICEHPCYLLQNEMELFLPLKMPQKGLLKLTH